MKNKLGLLACTFIIAGNMMGSGIALLPSHLAALGSITLWAWVITAFGALCLALVFAKLAQSDPETGGPVAYSAQISPILGYQASFLYYHANWIGNLATAITGMSYLSFLFPNLHLHPYLSTFLVISIIWLFSWINIAGVQWISRLVIIGISLLLIPVIITATWGWTFFDTHLFLSNWNVSNPHQSNLNALFSAIILCLWSFIGLESVSVNARLVKNPKLIVPLATLIGTSLTALIYISSTMVMNGLFPAQQLAQADAPFALSMQKFFGPWTTPYVALFTAFACFVSMGSWMLLTAEVGVKAATEGYFPKAYGALNAQGVPKRGFLLQAIQMSLLLLGLTLIHGVSISPHILFDDLVKIAVLLMIIPYYYSCILLMARCKFRPHHLPTFLITLGGTAFCLLAFLTAKGQFLADAFVAAMFVLLFYTRAIHKKSLPKIKT